MRKLDKENQLIAVEKVLEEMALAKEYVAGWNTGWTEQLLDAHCPKLHRGIGEADVRDMEDKYGSRYKIANAFYRGESIGIPLAQETLIGNNTLTQKKDIKFEVEFGRIDWFGMNSHKAKRYFSFNNDGTIIFKKNAKKEATPRHPGIISYDTNYNVLSNNFNIYIYLLINMIKLK